MKRRTFHILSGSFGLSIATGWQALLAAPSSQSSVSKSLQSEILVDSKLSRDGRDKANRPHRRVAMQSILGLSARDPTRGISRLHGVDTLGSVAFRHLTDQLGVLEPIRFTEESSHRALRVDTGTALDRLVDFGRSDRNFNTANQIQKFVAGMPDVPSEGFIDATIDFFQGVGSSASFGLTDALNRSFGVDKYVNRQSLGFRIGESIGYTAGVATSLRAAAFLSQYRGFRWFTQNRYIRIGYSNTPKGSSKGFSTHAPRISIGKGKTSKHWHIDLR